MIISIAKIGWREQKMSKIFENILANVKKMSKLDNEIARLQNGLYTKEEKRKIDTLKKSVDIDGLMQQIANIMEVEKC